MNTQATTKLGRIRQAVRQFGWHRLTHNNRALGGCRRTAQPPEPLEPRIVYSGTVPVL